MKINNRYWLRRYLIFNNFKEMKKIGVIIILLLILKGLYNISELNYENHLEIKRNIVNHPENLPTKETAENTSFGFKNLRADFYWLQAIQYIGWNAMNSDYKKYLYIMLDLITHLNPYFEHPYIIWQLLLPEYNQRYENLSNEEQNKYINQWIELWLKWMKNFCEEEKIELIKNENDLNKLWKNKNIINPCKTYTIPYYLAYIYHFYKKDHIKASQYYKIASLNEDSPKWAKIMTAIMQWKWWNREKSYFMFLNIASSLNSSDNICLDFAYNLEKIGVWLFYEKNIKLDENLIEQTEITRKKVLWIFDEEKELEILSDMECWNYVNKAIRELNLAFIEEANKKYKVDNDWENAANAKELFENWYIKYLPIDFQQYENHWIMYEYNIDTWYFDYKMWNY